MKRIRRCTLVIGAVAWLVCGSAGAVETEDFEVRTAQDLVDVCSTSSTDPLYSAATGFCHGYLVGAWEFYEASGRKFVCLPTPPPSRVEVLDGFRGWMAKNPSYAKEGAVQALFKYLTGTWSCSKEG